MKNIIFAIILGILLAFFLRHTFGNKMFYPGDDGHDLIYSTSDTVYQDSQE